MPGDVTILLNRYNNGEAAALDELAVLLYPELKAMARRRVSGNVADKGGFGATVLVNETFIKLLSDGQLDPQDRQQFFRLAATVMRQVVIDEVRYVTAQKRSAEEVTFADAEVADDTLEKAEFVLQVNEILERLDHQDERLAHVFECRYFAGYSTAETAEVLDLSERTVERLWSSARERIAALTGASNR